MISISKRQFLVGGIGLGLMAGAASVRAAEAPALPLPRKLKTTPLFKSPPGFPNAVAVAPEGLWIAEQKPAGANAAFYHAPEPDDLHENAWLVDWNGKLLKTVRSESRNTSGMAYGDGCVWMCANESPNGVFQTDMNSRTLSHRQIPLGPANNGGGCHGALYQDGKLWLASLRLKGILRVDPKSWEPEFLIPYTATRAHGVAWDNGAIWIITGNDSNSYAAGRSGLAKYDAATGNLLETAEFLPGSCDPHGLAMYNGSLYSCDAGIHPGWQLNESPTHGYIFRIDFV